MGFSMGGGEVARYFSHYGSERVRSVIFASSVTPYLEPTSDNPDGPLTKKQAATMTAELTKDEDGFYDQFATDFFSADGQLMVTEQQRQEAVALAKQSSKRAALACMASFGTTDFRDDLKKVSVPALIIQGDKDFIVFFEGSGRRTHEAIPGSRLHVVKGGPYGVNVSHADEWNAQIVALLDS